MCIFYFNVIEKKGLLAHVQEGLWSEKPLKWVGGFFFIIIISCFELKD